MKNKGKFGCRIEAELIKAKPGPARAGAPAPGYAPGKPFIVAVRKPNGLVTIQLTKTNKRRD